LLAWIAGGEILAPSCGAVISQNERGVRSTFRLQQSLVLFVSFCGAMRFSARVRLIYVPFGSGRNNCITNGVYKYFVLIPVPFCFHGEQLGALVSVLS
ncbi:MAG: hypothetical protein ACI9MB_004655, partial [Verrucomicrobiales bacterium]